MEFEAVLEQIIALLQRQGRISYGALKRRFQLDDAYLEDLKVEGGKQLEGYSKQSAALATKRFKVSLDLPGFIFMLTRAPDGHGNILLQIDKDSGQPLARVDLGKEREPVYAVDDVAGMLFLRTGPGTLVGYRL